MISEPGGYGTLVVTRAFAENLGLVFRYLACGSVAESQEHMPDRWCDDCGTFLRDGDGWIVPPDYPVMDASPGARDTLRLCNLCLLVSLPGAGALVAGRYRATRERWAVSSPAARRREGAVVAAGTKAAAVVLHSAVVLPPVGAPASSDPSRSVD